MLILNVAAGEAAAAQHRLHHRGAMLTREPVAQQACCHEAAESSHPNAVIRHVIMETFE